jgi:hypothetical protein
MAKVGKAAAGAEEAGSGFRHEGKKRFRDSEIERLAH